MISAQATLLCLPQEHWKTTLMSVGSVMKRSIWSLSSSYIDWRVSLPLGSWVVVMISQMYSCEPHVLSASSVLGIFLHQRSKTHSKSRQSTKTTDIVSDAKALAWQPRLETMHGARRGERKASLCERERKASPCEGECKAIRCATLNTLCKASFCTRGAEG